jgi:ubiquitin-protein ligase
VNVRLRRLEADAKAVERALANHPLIQIESTAGNPPQRYCLAFNMKGLVEKADGRIVKKKDHVVEISLLKSYPRQAPVCRMLTPVFHPNIAPHVICIGDDWSAGESLVQLIFRIGELITYQSYNIKSPLNGSAARWVEENLSRLPIDTVSLLPPELPPQPAPVKAPAKPQQARPASRPSPQKAAPQPTAKPTPELLMPEVQQTFVFRCGSCSAKLTAERKNTGRKIRCPKCEAVCRVPNPG